jgi:hypothetical protein
VASPLTYDSFIHCNLPVYPGAQENYSRQNLTVSAKLPTPSRNLAGPRAKPSNLPLVALIWLALLMLNPERVQAQSVLSDDAHVSLATRNANHGTNPNLNVSAAESVYLKFKLSTLHADTPSSEVEREGLYPIKRFLLAFRPR